MKLAAVTFAVPALLLAVSVDAKPKVYHAAGTEPFWTLAIGTGSITYKRMGGETIVTATPRVRATANGRRYVSPRITIDIARERCNDGMSDRSYPEAVKVTIGGNVVIGCGGDPLVEENLLQQTSWTIVSIDGRPARTTRPTRIGFADGRMSGTAGCNRLNGTYTLRGATLETRNIVSTRMACLGPGMLIERQFLTVIRTPAKLDLLDDGTLSLTSSGGTVLLRQARD